MQKKSAFLAVPDSEAVISSFEPEGESNNSASPHNLLNRLNRQNKGSPVRISRGSIVRDGIRDSCHVPCA